MCENKTLIAIHNKTPQFFSALLQPTPGPPEIPYFQHVCCVTLWNSALQLPVN